MTIKMPQQKNSDR